MDVVAPSGPRHRFHELLPLHRRVRGHVRRREQCVVVWGRLPTGRSQTVPLPFPVGLGLLPGLEDSWTRPGTVRIMRGV